MYRQLDEAPLERLEPFGRVRDTKHKPREGVLQLVGRDITTGGLARYSAHTPIWSMWTGPDEFAHWVLHTRQSTPYQAATSPDGQRRWSGPGGRTLIALTRGPGMSLRPNHRHT
jgi:hypothetical protein